MWPAIEATVTIWPLFFLSIYGKKAFTVQWWEVVLTLIVLSIDPSEFSKIFFPDTIPALLINISTSPKASIAS